MTAYAEETSVQDLERTWMNEAIDLATESVRNGGGPFGALIARGGEIVAIGNNNVTSHLDPTAHGEVSAIRAACQKLGSFSLEGCVLVTSCEPCPMCLSSALWARVDRVVYAADRHDALALAPRSGPEVLVVDAERDARQPIVAHPELPPERLGLVRREEHEVVHRPVGEAVDRLPHRPEPVQVATQPARDDHQRRATDAANTH